MADEHEIIVDAQRAKAEQLAVAAPLINLFTVVATLGLFLFFWLKAEIHIWVSGALAFTIAIILSRIIALFVGMLLGRRYARQLKARLAADPLLERADTLVQCAKINAIEMFTPLFREFPCLRAVEPENWNFILTVAGVFVAATRLKNQHLGNAREQKLWDKAYKLFIQWDANAGRAFGDCKSFFERNYDALTEVGHEPQFVASNSIGFWIVWNVLGRAPHSEEERKLVRVVGGMTTHAFFDWWDD